MSSTLGPTWPGKWRGTETSGALTWKRQHSALGHANDDDEAGAYLGSLQVRTTPKMNALML